MAQPVLSVADLAAQAVKTPLWPHQRWLRHSVGTLCASSGLLVGDIQTHMSHSHVQTTQIYMHHAPEHYAAEKLTAASAPAASGPLAALAD